MTPDSTFLSAAQALGDAPPGGAVGFGQAPFSIGGRIPGNTVFLAPLSGITDVPFRRRARRFGAGLVVSEMVASGELVRGWRESLLRIMRDGDGVHVVQLAGRDPGWMQQAAERAADMGADIIDINMGCPAKKVVGGQSGSALMREPDLALRLVEATIAGAGAIPVTLKMRLGWDHQTINSPDIAARAEAAGVQMITVHGRTRQQLYTGSADWHAIAAVKAAVSVPVVANGDLLQASQRADMLAASGADAVMIGRGTYGRPWFPGLLAGAVSLDDLARLSFADFVVDHYEDMLGHYGHEMGVRHSRKHLGWYLDGFAAASGADLAADRAVILSTPSTDIATERLRRVFGAASIADIERGSDATQRREAA